MGRSDQTRMLLSDGLMPLSQTSRLRQLMAESLATELTSKNQMVHLLITPRAVQHAHMVFDHWVKQEWEAY